MMTKSNLRLITKRFLLVLAVSLLFMGLLNEGAHLVLKEKYDRPPETVELVIPAGTSDKVEAGGEVPSIPSELVFVVGDTLKVTNEDRVDHQLGPLWVPAGTSASMLMENANKYALGCSFQPSRYMGIDVRSRTTAWSRVQAFSLATPPTAMFLFVYSLLIFPLNKKDEDKDESLVQPKALISEEISPNG